VGRAKFSVDSHPIVAAAHETLLLCPVPALESATRMLFVCHVEEERLGSVFDEQSTDVARIADDDIDNGALLSRFWKRRKLVAAGICCRALHAVQKQLLGNGDVSAGLQVVAPVLDCKTRFSKDTEQHRPDAFLFCFSAPVRVVGFLVAVEPTQPARGVVRLLRPGGV